MDMRTRYVFYICILFYNLLFSQFIDSLYIRKYTHKIIVNPWLGVPSQEIQISTKKDSLKNSINYQANNRILVGVDFSYRNLSISLGIPTRIYANNSHLFGKSKLGAFSMRFTYRKWAFEGRYSKNIGFAAFNSDNKPTDSSFFFRKDLRIRTAKISAIYTFNAHKFSYGASFNYAYRQLKSAWSPIITTQLYSTRFSGEFPLIDSTFLTPHHPPLPYNNCNIYALGVAPGISGTYIFHKRFFLTGIFSLGVDGQINNIRSRTQQKENKLSSTYFYDFRFAVGYNTNRIFSAITFKGHNILMNLNQYKLENNISVFTIELGYRLDTPKWVKKTYDKMSI